RDARLHAAARALAARARARGGGPRNALRRRAGRRGMKRFATLFDALDASTSTRAKTDALAAYFSTADARDAAWAAWFLTGHRPRQAVPSRRLHAWAAEAAGIPPWLFEECFDNVGDLAETIALVLPPPARATDL